MRNRLLLAALSFVLSGAWWIIDKQYGDELFKRVRAVIPTTWLPETFDQALDNLLSFGPAAALALIGTIILFFAASKKELARAVFGPVRLGMGNEKIQLVLPIKATLGVSTPARIIMEVRKLTGKRIGEYVLMSEERIKKGDTTVGRINLDKRPKGFLLLNYFPQQDKFDILAEGGMTYTLPAGNYRLTVDAVGDNLEQKSHSYTVTKVGRDFHFSDGSMAGSRSVRIQD
jgi:hypothetical protein